MQESIEATISTRVKKAEYEFAQREREQDAKHTETMRRLEKRVRETVAERQALEGRLAAAEAAHTKALKRMVPEEEVNRMEQEATDALREANLTLDRVESKNVTLTTELHDIKARESVLQNSIEELEEKVLHTQLVQNRYTELEEEVARLSEEAEK